MKEFGELVAWLLYAGGLMLFACGQFQVSIFLVVAAIFIMLASK